MRPGRKRGELLRGRGPLTTPDALGGREPFTAETFARYRKSHWGSSDETALRRHLKHCVDALRMLFLAAVAPGRGQSRQQLPAVLDSFSQWCEQTRLDFHLEEPIQAQLEERKFKIGQRRTYGYWRSQHKAAPAVYEAVGFKDDRSKRDDKELFFGREAVPEWTPGTSMRGPRPGRILPRK